jgi:ketosteroid isomerase-like protein
MAAEDEVRDASRAFYAALTRMANGVAGAFDDVWSHSAAATAQHPTGGRTVGWDDVRVSFDQFAAMASDGRVDIKDQMIRVLGDAAFETGVEHGFTTVGGRMVTVEHRVTNIYHREPGGWKMVHHHSDPSMLDAVRPPA